MLISCGENGTLMNADKAQSLSGGKLNAALTTGEKLYSR